MAHSGHSEAGLHGQLRILERLYQLTGRLGRSQTLGQVCDAAVEAMVTEPLQRLGAGRDRFDLDVVVRQERNDAVALSIVVFDHEQALGVRSDERLEPLERALELARRRWLDEVCERPV